ncbi:MAG: nucleoside kinase, partial [Clostridia bacterium]|nr:nucleoside kinase [Clostridia bacterium]
MNGRNEEDRRIFERSARLILLLALRDAAPGSSVRFEHSIGHGVYMEVSGVSLTAALVRRIEARMREISQRDLPIVKARWTREQAVEHFRAQGQEDTVRLLGYRRYDYFNVYTCDGLSEYFYGAMVPSTGCVKSFALRFYYPGMVLLLPGEELDGPPAPFVESPQLMRAFAEASETSRILQCTTAADLDDIIARGEARAFIRVSEAIQERAIAHIADRIVARGSRIALIAGPSSSGKTTFANRLGVQLRACGRRPVAISLDNYYRNRADIPLGPDGKPDLECLDSIDVPLFNEQLVDLLAGREVELPLYSFITGMREKQGMKLRVQEDQILIIEGIHGLNDALSEDIPSELKFRVYVSALTQLNLDCHNRIRTTDVRLLRRMVRDHRTRGTDALGTLQMWDSVRAGEETYIFPYQEEADVMFNSSLLYEIAVLKK